MTVFELNTVRVRDADGAEGVGYTFTCGRNGVAIDALLERDFPSLVEGEDADRIPVYRRAAADRRRLRAVPGQAGPGHGIVFDWVGLEAIRG